LNTDIILNHIPDMGPVFFAAAAAVALGATLLVVAIGTQLRRLGLRLPAIRTPRTLASLKPRRKGSNPAESVQPTETGYTAHNFTGPAVSESARTPGPEILALAHRLGRVADSLEDMRRQLNLEMPGQEFSALKPEDFGVEYLYKTTSG